MCQRECVKVISNFSTFNKLKLNMAYLFKVSKNIFYINNSKKHSKLKVPPQLFLLFFDNPDSEVSLKLRLRV